ncbi:hypothetical protein FRC12_023934 [Ceratobasidium sp. 428]|nr:hypothetical protein FRC12_023934 [Ceratobasidium sp. 428]
MSKVSQQFRNVWAVSGTQKSLLTSVTVSPNGIWLMSASQDKDMVFVDFSSGTVVGTLDVSLGFFHVTSGVWRTDGRLYLGCSDGQAFQLDFDPGNPRPLSMRRLLTIETDHKTSIRALAFDPLRHLIAAGCGNEVYIYSQSMVRNSEEWNCVERIPGPCEGNKGTVTSLSFYGQSLDNRCLFIGHAMAGFCVGKSPGKFQRTAKGESVSSIGSATISSDERFIAISSLDQSIVTYPLGPNGPVIRDQREFLFHEQTEYSPIVPIALTSGNLIFKGTASGDVPVLDSLHGPLAPIQLGAKRIVRTLTTHGDRLVVGSSDAGEFQQGSRVECYSTGSGGADKVKERAHPNAAFPRFNLTLDDVLQHEQNLLATLINESKVYLDVAKRVLSALLRLCKTLRSRLIRRKTVKLMFWTWLLTVILIVDPPSTADNNEQASEGVHKSGSDLMARAPPVVRAPPVAGQAKPKNPGLTYLVTVLITFIISRFSLWGMWVLALIGSGCAKCLVFLGKLCLLVPAAYVYLTTKGPESLADAVCDALKEQGLGYVCEPAPTGGA